MLNVLVYNGERNEEPVNICVSSLAHFSYNGRRTCQRDCTLQVVLKARVRARLCRWGVRVWDLICGFCDVCTYAYAHEQRRWRAARVNGPKTHLEKEWVSKESLVHATGQHCGVTCATNACTAAVGRETNETHFYRRETVRARRYYGRRRIESVTRPLSDHQTLVPMTKRF